jgi:hypothetical protein
MKMNRVIDEIIVAVKEKPGSGNGRTNKEEICIYTQRNRRKIHEEVGSNTQKHLKFLNASDKQRIFV